MTQPLIFIIHTLGYIAMALCLLIVAFKAFVWNLILPYAMIRAYERGNRGGWSTFPLIEIIPFIGAIGLSFLMRVGGWMSPGMLALWGSVAIVGSYCHLAIVAIVYGFFHRRKRS